MVSVRSHVYESRIGEVVADEVYTIPERMDAFSVKAFAVSMPFRSSAGEGRRGEQSGADAFCPRAKAGGGRCEDGGARASSHNFASGEAAGQCGVYGFARVGGRPLPSGVAYEEVVEYPNSATVEEDTSWLDGCFSAAAGQQEQERPTSSASSSDDEQGGVGSLSGFALWRGGKGAVGGARSSGQPRTALDVMREHSCSSCRAHGTSRENGSSGSRVNVISDADSNQVVYPVGAGTSNAASADARSERFAMQPPQDMPPCQSTTAEQGFDQLPFLSLEGRQQPPEQESSYDRAFEFPFAYGSISAAGGNITKTAGYHAHASLSAFIGGGGAGTEATAEPRSPSDCSDDVQGTHGDFDEAALTLAADGLLGYDFADPAAGAYSPARSPEMPTREAGTEAAVAAAAAIDESRPLASATAASGETVEIAGMVPLWGMIDGRPPRSLDDASASGSVSALVPPVINAAGAVAARTRPGAVSTRRYRHHGNQRNRLPTSRLRFPFSLDHLDLGDDDLADGPLSSRAGGNVSVCDGGGGGAVCSERRDRASEAGGAGGRQKWSSNCGGSSLEACADGEPIPEAFTEATTRDAECAEDRERAAHLPIEASEYPKSPSAPLRYSVNGSSGGSDGGSDNVLGHVSCHGMEDTSSKLGRGQESGLGGALASAGAAGAGVMDGETDGYEGASAAAIKIVHGGLASLVPAVFTPPQPGRHVRRGEDVRSDTVTTQPQSDAAGADGICGAALARTEHPLVVSGKGKACIFATRGLDMNALSNDGAGLAKEDQERGRRDPDTEGATEGAKSGMEDGCQGVATDGSRMPPAPPSTQASAPRISPVVGDPDPGAAVGGGVAAAAAASPAPARPTPPLNSWLGRMPGSSAARLLWGWASKASPAGVAIARTSSSTRSFSVSRVELAAPTRPSVTNGKGAGGAFFSSSATRPINAATPAVVVPYLGDFGERVEDWRVREWRRGSRWACGALL